MSSRIPASSLGTLAADPRLWHDFNAICDCGGRVAGTPGERRALELARTFLAEIDPGTTRIEPVRYAGWRCLDASLQSLTGQRALPCKPLLGSQSTPAEGITAEVIDLGRGTPEQFEKHVAEVAGRIVMVRHEYPFSAGHLHRRRKLEWAVERGAVAFIIASPYPGGGVVSGSSGRGDGPGIPAVAVDYESAAALATGHAGAHRVRLLVRGKNYAGESGVALCDLEGETPQRVVLSAHIDGHDLAESALDNASGVAVAVAVVRALAPHIAHCRRGLRVCCFSAEEWALAGSRDYLDRMGPTARRAFAINVNLDTVAGDARLTALTSEFSGLDSLVRGAAAEIGMPVGIYRPLMANSDHYNFARHGIPSLRLVAGFDAPHSNVRHILTGADTRDKAGAGELKSAALYTAALVWRALAASDAEAASWRRALG